MAQSDTARTTDGLSPTECDGRTHRACSESMTTRALLDGRYEVGSQSGRVHRVDLTADGADQCDCLDSQQRTPTNGCKHVRSVKIEIAFGGLPHPDECPTDKELAAREPARPLPTRPPAVAVADGGQTIEPTTDSETATTSIGICRAISNRIRDLEREIDCYRAELHTLETALAVIEDVTEEAHPADVSISAAAPSHASIDEEQ